METTTQLRRLLITTSDYATRDLGDHQKAIEALIKVPGNTHISLWRAALSYGDFLQQPRTTLLQARRPPESHRDAHQITGNKHINLRRAALQPRRLLTATWATLL